MEVQKNENGQKIQLKGVEKVKNYNRIQIEKMADTNYLKRLFDEQKIIVQILVDEQTCEIVELVSYGLDKDEKSYCKYLVRNKDELDEFVIIETLYPIYNFKREVPLDGIADIDIDSDDQNVRDKWRVICDLKRAHERFGEKYRYEYYASKEIGDFGNFGGPLELKFIREWLLANGHQLPEI